MKNTVVLQHIVVGGFFFVLYVKQRLPVVNGVPSHAWKSVLSCWHGAGSLPAYALCIHFIFSW